MKIIIKSILTIAVLPFIIISSSFAFEKPLKTEAARPANVSGVFTLILYGANYLDDIETVAILDYEGDEYYFEPYAPEFDYRVKKGIPAKEALKKAEKFVSFHNSFWKYHLSKIVNHEGVSIGFEVKPLYIPFVYGFSDIVDVYYWLKGDGKVKVVIKLDSNLVERIHFPGSDAPSSGGE